MAPPDDRTTLQKAQDRLSAVTTTLQQSARASGLWQSPSLPVQFPAFDELPRVEGQPQGCMWGFYDGAGVKDEVGSINLLTPAVVKAASAEIRTGQHVQLDWSLDNMEFPLFGRKKFEHRVMEVMPGTASMDDEISMNTQGGSQWDGLKHYGHQESKKYYNGLPHEEAMKTAKNGTHNWCERGGIVGRGVLVDWLRWIEQTQGEAPSAVTRREITVEEIEEVLRYQGTTTRPGDILIVRSGFVRWHNNAPSEERKRMSQGKFKAVGVQGSEKAVRWLYDRHFAAVAGDTVAFEAWPPPRNGWSLHEWLLTQWGTPIGEMWNLETLSQACEQQRRWTFFLTSAPLHVKGGVGSPPQAIAIL